MAHLKRKALSGIRQPAKQMDLWLHKLFAMESDFLGHPLRGDRCIEYAYVVEKLSALPKEQSVLDIGAADSSLTTITRVLGFNPVHGFDLMPSPIVFPGVAYFQGDFLDDTFTGQKLLPAYDIIVLCSTLEHFGLERYGSNKVTNADIRCVQKVKQLLKPGGHLLLTIPYGPEKIIFPYHRIYNKTGPLLNYLAQNLNMQEERYHKNNEENIWVSCSEEEARKVKPAADNYALGLFDFIKSS